MPPSASLPLIVLAGLPAAAEPERWVGLACRANALDLIERALCVPHLGPIVVATPDSDLAGEVAALPVQVVPDEPGVPFHFGRRLQQVVERCRLPRFLYVGAGAGPLLTVADLSDLATRALALENGALTNNLYSADLLALAPAAALAAIDPPATDNDLAWRLAAAGLAVESLPASAATRLDLDTPGDVAIAAAHPACGPRLRRLAHTLPLGAERVHRLLAELHSPQGEVLIYGRVSAATWARLELLPCQTRVFAEERGMRASGRLARGQVHAWIGAFLQSVGPQGFFRSLAGACTAAILDTRVLFAHLGLSPSAGDRFRSDLLQPEAISDPTVRAFTDAALAAPVPLLLGGQALVSGGALALAESPPAPR